MISHIEKADSESKILLSTIFRKYSQKEHFLTHIDGYIEDSDN